MIDSGRWVRGERARMQAEKGAELDRDNEFLGKASVYFAANPPKRSDLL